MDGEVVARAEAEDDGSRVGVVVAAGSSVGGGGAAAG